MKSSNTAKRTKVMVTNITHYKDTNVIAECSLGLGKAIGSTIVGV